MDPLKVVLSDSPRELKPLNSRLGAAGLVLGISRRELFDGCCAGDFVPMLAHGVFPPARSACRAAFFDPSPCLEVSDIGVRLAKGRSQVGRLRCLAR